mgnify:CR=1 FL=1
MSDPKYTPTAEGLVHEDGYLLPDDEPLMILRGKDIGALSNIVDYVEMLQDQFPITPTIVSHLASSSERLLAFYTYQIENPELQSVGCSRRSHGDSIYFLKRAAKKLIELNLINDTNSK